MSTKIFPASCPVPHSTSDVILLAHGGGGRMMHRLLEQEILSQFKNEKLGAQHDGAVFCAGPTRLAFSTDSYVVTPLFFPGGDIGSLAVNGTVNDLAMCGARPLYLSAAFVMEEGFPVDALRRVVASMARAAEVVGVQIVTGDTKVVDRGKCDQLFINTSGVGQLEHAGSIAPRSVRAGDAILLSGDIGRHGIAVMASRAGLQFDTTIESDCAPVAQPALALLTAGIEVHCLRDLTRGGLATCLVEIAESSELHIAVEERHIAVREDVRGACELLGLDPMYLANEGRFIAFVPEAVAERALEVLRQHAVSGEAQRIGTVGASPKSMVTLESRIGTRRIVDMQSGEQLPRIC